MSTIFVSSNQLSRAVARRVLFAACVLGAHGLTGCVQEEALPLDLEGLRSRGDAFITSPDFDAPEETAPVPDSLPPAPDSLHLAPAAAPEGGAARALVGADARADTDARADADTEEQPPGAPPSAHEKPGTVEAGSAAASAPAADAPRGARPPGGLLDPLQGLEALQGAKHEPDCDDCILEQVLRRLGVQMPEGPPSPHAAPPKPGGLAE